MKNGWKRCRFCLMHPAALQVDLHRSPGQKSMAQGPGILSPRQIYAWGKAVVCLQNHLLDELVSMSVSFYILLLYILQLTSVWKHYLKSHFESDRTENHIINLCLHTASIIRAPLIYSIYFGYSSDIPMYSNYNKYLQIIIVSQESHVFHSNPYQYHPQLSMHFQQGSFDILHVPSCFASQCPSVSR